MLNNQIFDEVAEDYRKIHTENVKATGADSEYFVAYKIQEIRRKFKKAEFSKILDLGCGDGNSISVFNSLYPSCQLFGIDISEKSIQTALSKNISNASFAKYDGKTIPHADNTFDMVFIACVLHHVDPAAHKDLFKEIFRVLKPDGRLVIFEHNPYNPFTRKIVKDCIFDEDAILIKSNKLKKGLQETGFSMVKSFFTLFFPRNGIFKLFLKLEPFMQWLPVGGQYYISATKS